MSAKTPATFSLSEVLKEAAASTKAADPHAVAETAFRKIKAADRPEALRQALDIVASHFVTFTRPTTRSRPKKKARNRPAAAVANAVQDFLASREFSPLRGAWIRLAEATADDLASMAQARYDLAAANHTKGEWYERCSKVVADAGVNTFGDLPEAVVRELMGDDDEDEDEEEDAG